MQDAALFFRNRALASFHRRRRYPLLSPDWRHDVEDARRFIRYCRAEWLSRPGHGRSADPTEISRPVYALGGAVRTPRPITP